jgi:hypothetical protein
MPATTLGGRFRALPKGQRWYVLNQHRFAPVGAGGLQPAHSGAALGTV